MPLQHRHEYAAALPRGLLADIKNRRRSRRHLDGVHCSPAHIRQIRAGGSLTGRHALVPRVHLLALLAGPGPSGSADPSRRCQGCSHPCVRLHAQAALSFTRLLRQPGGGPFIPPG